MAYPAWSTAAPYIRGATSCALVLGVCSVLSTVGAGLAAAAVEGKVVKTLHIGKHYVRKRFPGDKKSVNRSMLEINATARNRDDFVPIGHLRPGDKFILFDERSVHPRRVENRAICTQCFNTHDGVQDPHKCLIDHGCKPQFAWGYIDGQDFKGCAWVPTGAIARKGSKRIKDTTRKKYKNLCGGGRPHYSYTKLAELRSPHCGYCGTSATTLTCCAAGSSKVLGCDMKAKVQTLAFPNYYGLKVKRKGRSPNYKHSCSATNGSPYPCVSESPVPAGCSGNSCNPTQADPITVIPAGRTVRVRYKAFGITQKPYAMARLRENEGYQPERKTRWAFVRWEDLEELTADPTKTCRAKGLLSTSRWGDYRGCGNEKSPSTCPANAAVGLEASPASFSSDVVGLDGQYEMCSVDGQCAEGDFCWPPDNTCRSCEDDNCAENFEELGCVEGDPRCDVCLDGECDNPPGSCAAEGMLVGPVPPAGSVDCSGAVTPSSLPVRGEVSLLRTTDDPDEVEVTVEVSGATPKSSYAIKIWEAGACTEQAMADTGRRVETDAKGFGEESLILPLPWAPSGSAGFGNGEGAEALVIVLESDATSPRQERFVTRVPMTLGTCSNCRVGTEVIGDEGFEAGALSIHTNVPLPSCSGYWCGSHVPGDGQPPTVAPTAPHTGAHAVQIDTRSTAHGRFIYQDLSDASACFRWTFFVKRVAGSNVASLQRAWDRGIGNSVGVSAVRFSDDGIVFTGWGASVQIPSVLSENEWHEVIVQGEGDTGRQYLSLDGEVIAELHPTVAPPYPAPQTVIIGDTSGNAIHGLYAYDDVSLLTPTSIATTTTTTATTTTTLGSQCVSGCCAGVVFPASISGLCGTQVVNASFNCQPASCPCGNPVGTCALSFGGCDSVATIYSTDDNPANVDSMRSGCEALGGQFTP